MGRERIIGLLWPDSPSESARHTLAESLYVIRRELGQEAIIGVGDELSLNHEIVRSDLRAFEEAAAAGDLVRAVELYQGPFLDGFYVDDAPEFERWVEGERDQLARKYCAVLERLADEQDRGGDVVVASQWWRRLAAQDPYNSRVAQRLMRALAAAGERAGALQYYSVHAALLREEIGTEPDPEVAALAEALRSEPTLAPVPAELLTAAGADAAREETQGEEKAAVLFSSAAPVEAVRATNPAEAPAASPAPGALDQAPPVPGLDGTVPPELRNADPPAEVDPGSERRVATVWLADIVGHSSRRTRDEAGARRLIEILHPTARAEVERESGHLVEFIGDAALAEFSTVDAAVRAALRLLEQFEEQTASSGLASTLRIGIHCGEIATTPDGGYYGDAVTAASRLQEEARAGSILVSAEVREQLRGETELRFLRRGVRILPGGTGQVEVFELKTAAPPVRPSPAPTQAELRPDRWPRRLRRSGIVLGALLLMTMAVGVLYTRGNPAHDVPAQGAAALDRQRVALLYLDDHSPGQKLDYLARGIVERVIAELSDVPGLEVVSRNGVKPYRDSSLPIDSIARILRAGTLIGGSIEESPDSVRVLMHLIDGASGTQLQSITITRPIRDLFNLEDDFASQVSRLLKGRLGRDLDLRRRLGGTESPEARELVLGAEKARGEAADLTSNPDPLEVATGLRYLAHADSLLMRAERYDPAWPEPIILRGWVALDRAARAESPQDQRLLREAISHANRVLDLRPRDAAALEVRGTAAWGLTATTLPADEVKRLVYQAVRDLRQVVEAEPSQASAWSTLSQLLRFQGDSEGSYFAAKKASSADAYRLSSDQIHERLYRSVLALGRYDLARRHCDAGGREFPTDLRFVVCRLVLMARDTAQPPDASAAWELVRRMDVLEPPGTAAQIGRSYSPIFRRVMVAAVLARAGQNDSARAVLARARKAIAGPDMAISFAYDEAYVALLLGDEEGALRGLARHLAYREADRRSIARDVLFARLWGDPRFEALVARR